MAERIRELKAKAGLAEASESVGENVKPLVERIRELKAKVGLAEASGSTGEKVGPWTKGFGSSK